MRVSGRNAPTWHRRSSPAAVPEAYGCVTDVASQRCTCPLLLPLTAWNCAERALLATQAERLGPMVYVLLAVGHMTPRMWIIALFSLAALLVIQFADRERSIKQGDAVARIQ